MSYQREYERRLRIGVVGCGSHSYRNLLPVLHYLPVKLLAVCDVNRGQAEKCALEYGCRYYENASDMYENEDLEAVFLCVGARQHSALAIEALDAGVHVWMEKPVAVRTEQVEQVIRHRGDRICMVGFKKASMPAARKANALARELGGMELLTATYPMTIPENGEALLAAGDMPNWLRNGVHPLSFLVYLGGRADQVCAVTGKQGTGTFLIKFANGIQGCLNMTPDIQPSIERYGIYGKGWQIEIDNRRVTLAQGIPEFQYDRTWDYTQGGMDSGKRVWEPDNCVATLENKALFTQGFYTETMEFCRWVLEGKRPESGTLEEALEIMRIYEAGLRSRGNWIAIH